MNKSEIDNNKLFDREREISSLKSQIIHYEGDIAELKGDLNLKIKDLNMSNKLITSLMCDQALLYYYFFLFL